MRSALLRARQRGAILVTRTAESELWLVAAVTAGAALAIAGCGFVLAVLLLKA